VVLRENSSEIMNIMGEVIAEIALRPDRLTPALDKARHEGRENLDRMDAWVQAQPRIDWLRPRAGLIGLGRLHGIDGDDLFRRLLEPPYKTFILPGSSYDLPGHVRLGVGGGAGVNLMTGLDRLGACLRDWKD
jgi:aspartate/methionine/tyrosine aminotransferase